jgi:hypothetical protein
MNVIIILIVVAIIAFIGSKIAGESNEDAVGAAGGAAVGCGFVILQIFLAGISILFILWIFNVLFG